MAWSPRLKRTSNFNADAARCACRWRVFLLSRLKPLLQLRAAPL